MNYQLHFVNSVGMHKALETPFATLEQAMTTACPLYGMVEKNDLRCKQSCLPTRFRHVRKRLFIHAPGDWGQERGERRAPNEGENASHPALF
jgi:hypothetical protein